MGNGGIAHMTSSSYSLLPSSRSASIGQINFEDMQSLIAAATTGKSVIIISTLKLDFQKCVIRGTIPADQEETRINDILSGVDAVGESITIIVYGKNSVDDTVLEKYEQLLKHGITRVCVYAGGMFEWLLMQDIYGAELFQTTGTELDILRYRPPRSSSLLC
jgi:hypothetical protein